ncbi:hypothetical protein [Planctomicrobium sp. SH664]|uniref:hypothetical protein n=1 Tax=Planctomicrobium sp. SH664 TaxID=3448125 RepID=UPI003F5C775D
MRVSKYYNLGRSQPTLDFVDVDIENDTRLFVDPHAIRMLPDEWGDECVGLLEDFFETVLNAIRGGKHSEAKLLLASLREPNETHLGMSVGRSQGSGVGRDLATDLWQSLCNSTAVSTGLMRDLEDTVLMVPNVDADRVSDITTNIIREPLIRYTRTVCELYGIPLRSQVDSGPLWDPTKKAWHSKYVELPVTKFGKLILVPKVIIRQKLAYDAGEYYQHYILTELQQEALNDPASSLVRVLKTGRRKVTKKSLKNRFGSGKDVNERESIRLPEVIRRYREHKEVNPLPPLNHDQIAVAEGSKPPDWDELLQAVIQLRTGRESATAYEKAVEKLLSALFYPALATPQLQTKIHDGRKIVDITYTNAARSGFFWWLHQHYTCPYIFVECKNYASDPANPELDQLSGRFSPQRGKVGVLVCRQLKNKDLFMQRCIDTARDQRGFIIPLDDSDLKEIVEARGLAGIDFPLLRERFDQLVL